MHTQLPSRQCARATLLLAVLLLSHLLKAPAGLAQTTAEPRYYCREHLGFGSPVGQPPPIFNEAYFPSAGAALQLLPNPFNYGLPLCDSSGAMRYATVGNGSLRLILDRAGSIIPTSLGLVSATAKGVLTGLIIPVPHRPRFSLVFCLTRQPSSSNNRGWEVSVLDGRLRGGLGDLVVHPDSLRQLLVPAAWEDESAPLTVVRHANGRDLWVVTAQGGTGFLAFLVTPAGLTRHVTVSQMGTFAQLRRGRRVSGGYLQFSANQRTAVLLSYGEAQRYDPVTGGPQPAITLERFAFDPATGQFSAPALLYAGFTFNGGGRGGGTGDQQTLGIAPNGERLYVGESVLAAGRPDSSIGYALVQYDLRAADSVAFKASRAEVARRIPAVGVGSYHGILSGLDGRVYCLQNFRVDTTGNGSFSAYIDVVDRPAAPAARCGFRADAIVLSPPGQQISMPQFRRFFLPLAYNAVLPVLRAVPPICPGSPSRLTLTQPGAVDSVRWHYADGSGVVDTGFAATHVFPGPGQWAVTVTYRYNGYGVDSLTRTVVVAPAPPTALLAPLADAVLCEGAGAADAIVLRARADSLATGLRWQWAGPGTTAADTLPTLAARQAGTYRLTARLGACFSTDSVTLRAAPCTVYNVVTPNADGRNDGLTVELPGQWTLEVYSRWGRRVWASAPGGYESGTWPTAAEAADLPASTYFYHLTRPADGRRLRGWVQVVR